MREIYKIGVNINIGQTFWFDSEGIGSDTPLGYFGWDFADCAEVIKIENDKIILSIHPEMNDEVQIIVNERMFNKIMTPCSLYRRWMKNE